MTAATPIRQDLVLLGGGLVHALLLRAWAERPVPGVQVTLISNASAPPYAPMIGGYLSGKYQLGEILIDLRTLARKAGARLLVAEGKTLDLERKRVGLPGRPAVAFDFLSIDTGSTSGVESIRGAGEFAIPVKPLGSFLHRFTSVEDALRIGRTRTHIVVVGGGAGGFELACSLRPRFPKAEILIIDSRPRLLASANEKASRLAADIAQELRISFHGGDGVREILANRVLTVQEKSFPADAIFLATGAHPPQFAREGGLATDPQGFISVHPTFQSISHPFVFAAGDAAGVLKHSGSKSAESARLQAGPYFDNLRCALSGKPLKPFTLPPSVPICLGTKTGAAMVVKSGWVMRSSIAWRRKERRDRLFMKDLGSHSDRSPSARTSGALPPDLLGVGAEGRCGGAAAKVPAEVLVEVLRRLKNEGLIGRAGEDVALGLNAPDDAAVLRVPAGKELVQSVDLISAIVSDPYLLGRITLNHCFNDIFAMGARPWSMQALAILPAAGKQQQVELLYQFLSGALFQAAFSRANLVGGHTAEGPEHFGFAVNGLLSEGAVMRKSGLQPGDKLLLTKPLGVGVLFQGAAQGKSKPSSVDDAIRAMLVSNEGASTALRRHEASACTDVSGFGLGGALVDMLRASNVSAELELKRIPALPGALELLTAGSRSSLHDANREVERFFVASAEQKAEAAYALLFDPQTSGGLLAGARAERATACLEELRGMGLEAAAIIGEVVEKKKDGGVSIAIR